MSKYSTVLTHHPDGDVGNHPQHTQVSCIVRAMVDPARLYYFSVRTAEFAVELTGEEMEAKATLLDCYTRIANRIIPTGCIVTETAAFGSQRGV